MADQERPRSWYALATPDDGPAEVRIYDDIGLFGITAADFVQDLATIESDQVTVRINSYGGDVFEGIAILNSLRGLDATTTVIVDGIAASIASVIALGGDKLVMNQNSQMMIHNAWNFASGNADELQRVADGLRSMSGNIASIYAAKAGGTAEEWQARMNAETWYTADEAVAAGLADEVIVEVVKMPTLAGVARASASATHFKYPGREAAPAPVIPPRAQTPLPVEAEVTQGKDITVAILSESALETLGLDAEADQDAVNAAIIELGNRQPADPEPVVIEPTLAVAQAVVTAAGQVTMEADAFAALQDAAQQGAQARAQQVREGDERAVDAAIARGAVAPARRDHHLAALAADREGHGAVLTALASGLVVPLAEAGHGQGTEATNADDVLYASLFGQETN